MPNRNIQQKILKMKRQRRAWARSYSMRSTGVSKHFWAKDDNNKDVDMGPGARNQLASSTTDFNTMDRQLLRTFKSDDTEVIYARTHGLHTDLFSENPIVLARMVHSTSYAGSLQKEQRYVYKVMLDDPNQKVRWYMSGRDSFFVRETRTETEMVYRISYLYDNLANAQLAYTRKSIKWNSDLTQKIPLIS